MTYKYPEHFKYPPDHSVYFTQHIENWARHTSELFDKPNVTLEIGALFGGASVCILDTYCKQSGSHHYVVDINSNEYIENNLKPYKNFTYCLGDSSDVCRKLTHGEKIKEFVDLAYIDGNHMSKFVLEDAINCFYLTKNGGYIIFDDYGWGESGESRARPATGIEAFLHAYEKYLKVVDVGWQVILKKVNYDLSKDERESNYYENWKWTTKTVV